MKILIIDDNATHRLIHRTWITNLSKFEVIETDTAAKGFALIVSDSPVCVLLDYVMLGEDGFQALHRMKHDIANCPPIILLTCALTEDLRRNAMALGASACFDKAEVVGADLIEAIKAAVGSHAN